MTTHIKPKKNQVYTLAEIINILYLRDSPALTFIHNECVVAIQDGHVTSDELLSVPGMSESKWKYLYETEEWIPVFSFVANINQPTVDTFLDIVPWNDYKTGKEDPNNWFATPKGFPLKQN